ncbi:MAG: hypothetical protein JW384_01200 [Nitrosomonadaceae bacterium]|nr:hypothetical protein [Nitrosomonadaceae bacterium]
MSGKIMANFDLMAAAAMYQIDICNQRLRLSRLYATARPPANFIASP